MSDVFSAIRRQTGREIKLDDILLYSVKDQMYRIMLVLILAFGNQGPNRPALTRRRAKLRQARAVKPIG